MWKWVLETSGDVEVVLEASGDVEVVLEASGDVEVVLEVSGAICLTRFLMYSSASSTSSGVNCGQTLCGDILTQCKQQDFWRVCLLSTISTIFGKKSKRRVKF